MSEYFGQNHQKKYILGKRISSGGEGAVFEVVGKNNLVAKIYHDNRLSDSGNGTNSRTYIKEKIQTMLEQSVNPYINGVLSIAWPQDTLEDNNGVFVGYVMPRVDSKHHIFAASRERERNSLYPNYNWKIGIAIAYNLALAVNVIHESNAVIGDFNSNNIMIDEKGHITLIDTDSFNITNKKTGKEYKCSVGVPDFLAPELQGKHLGDPNNKFSEQTDCFSLAIHIFNLLMNNCHPFGCTGINKMQSSSSTNPVVKNIVRGICPYVSKKNGSTSPSAPDFEMLPNDIRELFTRTFSYSIDDSVKQKTIMNRPSANEWQNALGKLYYGQFNTCKKNNKHVYIKQYKKCPWCEVEKNQKKSAEIVKTNTQLTVTSQSTNTVKNANNNVVTSSGSKIANKTRNAFPLWLFCVSTGIASAPLFYKTLCSTVKRNFEYSLDFGTAQLILLILGGVVGLAIAYLCSESYKDSDFPIGWLFISLLVPIVTGIVAAIILLILFILYWILKIIIGLIVIIFILFVIGAGE